MSYQAQANRIHTPFNQPQQQRNGIFISTHTIVAIALLIMVAFAAKAGLGKWFTLSRETESAVITTETVAVEMIAPTPVEENPVATIKDTNQAKGLDASFAATTEARAQSPLSRVFAPQVLYWETDILRWSAQYGVDPNHIATIMQIESCGNPNAVSGAGAQGLFQVMPFHFEAGEQWLDPETNAKRGMLFFTWLMENTNGNRNVSFAGYNGGLSTTQKARDYWPDEMIRYEYWASGIAADIDAGLAVSGRLQEWMQAGGASLCQQAHVVQSQG